MAYFAKLDDSNYVTDVNVVDDADIQNLPFPESEAIGIQFLQNWSGKQENWKQTSVDKQFRKNFASVGYYYDINRDAFIPIKPFNSWVLNEETCQWDAPVPEPEDKTKPYLWDEESLSWIEVQIV